MKKAFLVTFEATSRVVADVDADPKADDNLFQKIVNSATEQIAENGIRDYLTAENASVVEDTECPYVKDEDGIMDTTNNHNKSYVESINKLWRRDKDAFKTILCALYNRDFVEIYKADPFAFLVDEAIYHVGNADALEIVRKTLLTNPLAFARNYLMHIADDADLSLIINFIDK